MNTTRTVIAAIAISLITPVGSEAQPPSTAAESSGSNQPVAIALSSGPTREASASPITAAISIELDGATVYAENEAQIDTVEWSLQRYADYGLELPHVTIEMRSIGKCPTHDGRQLSGSLAVVDGEYRIKVCGERRTLLHELGHVWDKHNMTDDARSAYMELRGLDSWRHDVWHLAAGEHVAETMTWALDSIYLPPSRIANNSTAELAAGYELLTGASAPVLAIAPPIQDPAEPIGDRQIAETTPIPAGDTLG
jgi:hypothetical protein